MLPHVLLGLFVLLSLFPFWNVLDLPGTALNPWMFAAYAIIFASLSGYRTWLSTRERRYISERCDLLARLADRSQIVPRRAWWRDATEQLALVGLALGMVLALSYAPREKTMGELQRIFYVHVPCAWVAFLAFLIVGVASVVYLIGRHPGADRIARSSAEVGVLFTTLVLISGPIWAKPAWGIWWTWDMRLTTTLVLWLVYIGYLMLRVYIPDPERRGTLAAVVGILGVVGVYVDYMAIRWWRTQHPAPVIGGGEGSGLDPMMLRAFLFNLVAFTLVYLAFLFQRQEIARGEDENDALALRLGDVDGVARVDGVDGGHGRSGASS